jgi:Na+/proline symporter
MIFHSLWTVLPLVPAIMVGLANREFLPSLRNDSEKIVMTIVSVLPHPIVAGILLAAILSAICVLLTLSFM